MNAVDGVSRCPLWVAVLLAIATVWPLRVHAWPERPVKLVVPYAAGGVTDSVSRVLAGELAKQLGTAVVVENRPGAAGQVGLQSVLAAPRDGHTVALVVPATMITLPLTNKNYNIQPLREFVPLTVAVASPLLLVVNKDLGVKTLAEFADRARMSSGGLNYGVPGWGTSFHLGNLVLADTMGFVATAITYPGEAPVFTDLASGRLQYALLSSTLHAQMADSGKVVTLAISSAQRVSALPQVPTFAEQGVDFSVDGWVGYAVAAGTPAPVVDRLSDAFGRALRNPAVAERLTQLGLEVVGSGPAEFRAVIEKGTLRQAALLRAGVLKLD